VECDANFFRGQEVAVIGAESAAAGGALTLLDYDAKVHLICHKLQVVDALRQELERSRVILHHGASVAAIDGEKEVTGVVLKDGTRIPTNGVFIELGAKGVMGLATALGIRLDDEAKYIQTDKKQRTSVSGCSPPVTSAAHPGRWPKPSAKAAWPDWKRPLTQRR
jgi:thioredoxin reductase (NADPH)